MEHLKITAEVLDPTGVVTDHREVYVEVIKRSPSRILLTIGEYQWLVTGDGETIKKITK